MVLVSAPPTRLLPKSSARRPVCAAQASMSTKSKTQLIMESIATGDESGGAGGGLSYQALKGADKLWSRIRNSDGSGPIPQVVARHAEQWRSSKFQKVDRSVDVVVCGGTLGIFFATVLSLKGFKVAIVEKGVLRGRVQEWNISRRELQELVDVGIVSREEMEEVISIEFNPNRCKFDGGSEVWVTNALNLGISPVRLIDIVKKRFMNAGGLIIDGNGVLSVDVFEDAAVTRLQDGTLLSSRLVLDAMGNFSPIVHQIRRGKAPDGMCLVVGTCARGFQNNSASDLICTISPITLTGSSRTQYFWEAFPAGSGPRDRTTYMFSYMDATPSRPSLEDMLEDYWDRMPSYQGVQLGELKILRVLFGLFPTYRSSPLPAAFDRILQVGDASGIQSPVSFGGFASITRHIKRLSHGIIEALVVDKLDSSSLSLLNPYMPNLSGAWLLQKAMSVRAEGDVSPTFINELLGVTFQCMEKLGEPVLQPFLQDVIQFLPLAQTMGSIMVAKPAILPEIFREVGFVAIADWLVHFVALALYTAAFSLLKSPTRSMAARLPGNGRFVLSRRLEAWEYGAGLDYKSSKVSS